MPPILSQNSKEKHQHNWNSFKTFETIQSHPNHARAVQSIDASQFLKVLASQQCSNDGMISISRHANTIQMKAPQKHPRHQGRLLIRDVVFLLKDLSMLVATTHLDHAADKVLDTCPQWVSGNDSTTCFGKVLKCPFWFFLNCAAGMRRWIL